MQCGRDNTKLIYIYIYLYVYVRVCQARSYTYVGLVTLTIDILPRYRWALHREDCIILYMRGYPDDVIDRIPFLGLGQSHERCQEGDAICVSLYYRCLLEKKRGVTKRGMISIPCFFLSSYRATHAKLGAVKVCQRPLRAFSVSVGAQSRISSSGNCSTKLPSPKGRNDSEITRAPNAGSPCPERMLLSGATGGWLRGPESV